MVSDKVLAVKQTRPLAGRITYFRNFLHYAFWSNSPNVDYAATSLGLIPSRIWFTRARRIPPGYQRISWKCVRYSYASLMNAVLIDI